MRYGLSSTIVHTAKDLQGNKSQVIATVLQKMHISIKIPTAIRHGPIALGELDLYNMRTEIGAERLKLLRDSLFADSATGKYIMINLRATQLEAGVDFCILVEEPS